MTTLIVNAPTLSAFLRLANQTANQTALESTSYSISAEHNDFNLTDLAPHTPYKLYLWAETSVGPGEPFVLEEHAMRESGK